MVNGFKAFNEDMTNRYGQKFEEGKIYQIPKGTELSTGNNGTGIHFSPNLEDCFHFVDAINFPCKVARVSALGRVLTFNDSFEYYGFYDLSATDKLRIDHIMTREEIMDHMLTTPGANLLTFIRDYKLEDEEARRILETFPNNHQIALAINYYHNGDKETYFKYYGVKR